MNKNNKKTMLIVLGVAIIIFLFLWLSSGRTPAQLVNKVADAFGLPNVKGFDINAEGSTFNIPGLKYRKGCGQLACSSNVIPQTPGSMGLANPQAKLLNTLGAGENVSAMVRDEQFILVHTAPPFYPFGVDRMVGGTA